MESKEVSVGLHNHMMMPLKDRRMGNCCGIKFEAISDGYYCSKCDYFAHESCSNAPYLLNHPSHICDKTLYYNTNREYARCRLCGRVIVSGTEQYQCGTCDFKIHFDCSKYPPPEVIDVPQNHDHKLKLEMRESCFTCAACGKDGDEYSYKCHECHLTFHVNCKKYPAEVSHPSHSLHPLKIFKGEPPAYTDGKCSLCGKKLVDDEVFYHCSTCNYSLDRHCVHDPPPLYFHDLNNHDHKLTLMPKKISFTCTVCGLNGDRSPYVCLQCYFISHNDCYGIPWVININRHNHRVSRTSLLGVVNSVCGVCRKKMDWSCGGYSCLRCPGYVFHTKCATRKDVSDGIEMKEEPEEDEEIPPYKVIDENIIQHFSHTEHNLRLDKSGIFNEERGSCEACAYPIYHQSFYSCMGCNFILHESCANLPTQRWHVKSIKPYILRTTQDNYSKCRVCKLHYNGFIYGIEPYGLDVRCASVSEVFFHQSHPDHPLYYTSPGGVCNACNKPAYMVLRCVEDNCGYVLDFKCALLPYLVKHRVDDHFLALCYDENASGKYWCDICEEETDPKTWYYTCKDCGVTLHTNCVLGDFRGLNLGKTLRVHNNGTTCYEIVQNKSMTRPLCHVCKSRCIFPTILKVDDDSMPAKYRCSVKCCNM